MITTPRMTLALLATLALLTACECRQAKPAVESEPAGKQESKEKRDALPGLDHGLVQSPVNILTSRAEGGHHEVAINLHHAEPNHLENKGHTIQLDFQPGSSVTFDGREYQLKQFHFHTPSEHQIDGITYPMEGHIVNIIEPKTPEDPTRYLVVSFLFRMGDEDSFITSFLDQVPRRRGRRGPRGGSGLPLAQRSQPGIQILSLPRIAHDAALHRDRRMVDRERDPAGIAGADSADPSPRGRQRPARASALRSQGRKLSRGATSASRRRTRISGSPDTRRGRRCCQAQR